MPGSYCAEFYEPENERYDLEDPEHLHSFI